ncbi:MAG: AMIN domain-containing protein [Candidatus Rokubacteria bacterium]|nr:AMIN domain-containing protein [Candidatus Rokubacteria bacterium]
MRLSDITVDPAKVTTVQIKTSGAAKYRAELMDKPPRLVIDLQDTSYVAPKTPPAVSGDPIKQIRVSQFKKNVARVVIEFTRKVEYKIVATPTGLNVVVNAPSAVVAAPAAKPPAAKPEAGKAETSKPAGKVAMAPGAAAPAKPGVAKAEKVAPADAEKAATAKKPAEPKIDVAKVESAEVAAAQPPAPAPLAPATDVTRLISFDFKDADVVNLLRILATESGKNIVIGDDVKGKMSITLNNVPWQVALDTILEARGLQKIERDNLIRIVSNEQLTREREATARVEEAKLKAEADVRQKLADAKKAEQAVAAAEQALREAQARGPLREETIRLSYADPDEVAKTLQGILGIPPQGIQASPLTPTSGPPPIAEPPFSQLYGTGPSQQPRPPGTPSAEVLSRGITIQANKPTNSIFIRHYERDLERIKKLIHETLDIPLPQVKIEARLESLDRFALENLGVQWGGGWAGGAGTTQYVGQGLTTSTVASGGGSVIAPSGGIAVAGNPNPEGNPNFNLSRTVAPIISQVLPISAVTGLPTGGSLINLPVTALPTTGGINPSPTAGFSFGIIGTRFNINLALQALAEQQKTRTIARPEVVTVENNKATIALGREIPYATVSSAGTQVQFRDAVLQLQVTPVVIIEGPVTKVKLTILVENNEQGTDTAAGPTIIKRRAETQVLVKEGEHLVIGGVGTATESKSVRKVPLFGDIPLLGWLFKQRGDRETSSELVVFITPSVLKQGLPTVQPTPAR